MIDNKLDLGSVDFGAAAGTFFSDSVDLFGLGNTVQGAFAAGDGNEICLHISVTEAAVAGTNAVMSFVASDTDALNTNIEVLSESIALVPGQLALGAEVVLRAGPGEVLLDYNDGAVLRYIGLRITTTGTHTAGIVQVHALPAQAINQSRRPEYPSGFTI